MDAVGIVKVKNGFLVRSVGRNGDSLMANAVFFPTVNADMILTIETMLQASTPEQPDTNILTLADIERLMTAPRE